MIESCLEPGVSVAGLALEHGVNANQLRNWVARRRRGQEQERSAHLRAAGLIPVVKAASIARASSVAARPTRGT
ncbi:transposase [Rhizobium mongolense]|uniref:Transposase-like protein n=1 Tax=Rhizobium mongolense TaxID=57676 RepID=A0ABR6IYG9_9HYPH|nr:transposase [Rhizobium mongolense]MBB4232840.1 transposase-like protein [Rhizobium mongolense]